MVCVCQSSFIVFLFDYILYSFYKSIEQQFFCVHPTCIIVSLHKYIQNKMYCNFLLSCNTYVLCTVYTASGKETSQLKKELEDTKERLAASQRKIALLEKNVESEKQSTNTYQRMFQSKEKQTFGKWVGMVMKYVMYCLLLSLLY